MKEDQVGGALLVRLLQQIDGSRVVPEIRVGDREEDRRHVALPGVPIDLGHQLVGFREPVEASEAHGAHALQLVESIPGTVSTAANDTAESVNAHPEFRWESANAQWVLNLSVRTLAADQTYAFLIRLNDGSGIEVRTDTRGPRRHDFVTICVRRDGHFLSIRDNPCPVPGHPWRADDTAAGLSVTISVIR